MQENQFLSQNSQALYENIDQINPAPNSIQNLNRAQASDQQTEDQRIRIGEALHDVLMECGTDSEQLTENPVSERDNSNQITESI